MANPIPESLAQLSARVRKAKGLPDETGVTGAPEDTSGSLTLAGRSLEDQSPAVGAALRNKQLLDEMKRNLAKQGVGFSTGATSADVDRLQSDQDQSPYGEKAAGQRSALDQQLQTANDPRVKQLQASELADRLKLTTAPAEAQAKGLMGVETIKTEGENQRQQAQLDADQKLRDAMGIGKAPASPGVSGAPAWKPKEMDAQGHISYEPDKMPALIQRSYDQLDAAERRLTAGLQGIEGINPGINSLAESYDHAPSQSWLSMMTGLGAPKGAGLSDRLLAKSEYEKYQHGGTTPYSGPFQNMEFGAIEQMAGQLPGVRGLATVVPLFKKHQPKWGEEPLAVSVQKTRHLAQILAETKEGIRNGSVDMTPIEGFTGWGDYLK